MSPKRHKPRSLDRDSYRDHNGVQNSRSRSEPQRSGTSSYPPTETYTTAVEPSTNRRIITRGICGLPDFYSKLLGPTAEETLLVGFKTFLKIGLACNSDSEQGDYTISTSIEGSGIFTENEQDYLETNDENVSKLNNISIGTSISERYKREVDYDEKKPFKKSSDIDSEQEKTIISDPKQYIKEESNPTSVELKETPQTSEKKSDIKSESKNGSQLSETFDQTNDKLDKNKHGASYDDNESRKRVEDLKKQLDSSKTVSKIEDSNEKENEKTSEKIVLSDSILRTSLNSKEPSPEVSITILIEKPESKTKKSSIITKEEIKDMKLEKIKEEGDENVQEDMGIKQEPVDETSDRKSKKSSIESSEYEPSASKEKEETQSMESATSNLSKNKPKSISVELETSQRKSKSSSIGSSEYKPTVSKEKEETQSMQSAISNLSHKKSKSVSIELYEVQPTTPEELSIGQSKKQVTEESAASITPPVQTNSKEDSKAVAKDQIRQKLSERLSKQPNDIPSKVSTKYILEPSPGQISSQSNNISKLALSDALKKLYSCHSKQQDYPECRQQNVKQSLKIQHIQSRTFPPSQSSLKVEVSKKSTVCCQSKKSIKSQNVSKMSNELTPNIPEEDEEQDEISETYDRSDESDESLEDVPVKTSTLADRRAAISREPLTNSSRSQAERSLERTLGSREKKMFSSTQSTSENPEASLTDSKKSSVSWSSQQSESFVSGKISPKVETSYESKRSDNSDIKEPSRYSSKRSHDERSSVVSQESKSSGYSNSKRVLSDGLKIKVSQETIEEVSEKSEKSDDKSESEIIYKTETSFETGKKDQSKSFISVKISEETESEESEETDKSDKSIQYEKPEDLQKSEAPEYKEKKSKKSPSGVKQSKKFKSGVSDSKTKRKREILVEVTEESDGSIISVKSDKSKRSKGRLDKKPSPVLQLTKPVRDKSSSTSSILKTSSSSDKSDTYTCTCNLQTGINVCQCGDARIQTDCNCSGQIKSTQLEKVIPIQCPYIKPCLKTAEQAATGVCSRCKNSLPEESTIEEHKQKKLCFDCYTSTSSSTASDSNSKWRKNMCRAYTKGQVRYAITKITEYGQFTTFEIMKSTRKVPKFMPATLEGVFVLKRKV
ncbi:uncharacterized protein [Diabrotica undecimpunctata]|uniref:uncharacterized protein isoform X2 n=1 Tax=Diabrotica undecimpunctata TaxID=50387 RepID=UPI003B639354